MRILFTAFLILISLLLFSQSNFPQFGKASFYADKFEGKLTASGEKYKHNSMTAAHKSLAFGTKLKVTNLTNGKSVVVTINDRGPYVDDRIIDVSRKAASKLDFIEIGIVDVKIELAKPSDEIVEDQKEKPETSTEEYKEFTYYEVNSKLVNPKSYGIQIGSYSDSGNLLKTIAEFNSKHSYKILVQESVQSGKRKYRLIIGTFENRKEAESKLNELRKWYKDCFVLNLE